MGRWSWAVAVLALAACVPREETRPGGPPPRAPESELERAYLRCVGADPLFLTTSCREINRRLSADPWPGLAAR